MQKNGLKNNDRDISSAGRNSLAWRQRRAPQGQSILEMALIVPMATLLIVGTIEFGRFYMIRQVITNAAREGARILVLSSTTSASQVTDVVRRYIQNAGLNPDLAAIDLTGLRSSTGTPCTVRVSYPFESVVLRMIRMTSSSVRVRAISTMMHE